MTRTLNPIFFLYCFICLNFCPALLGMGTKKPNRIDPSIPIYKQSIGAGYTSEILNRTPKDLRIIYFRRYVKNGMLFKHAYQTKECSLLTNYGLSIGYKQKKIISDSYEPTLLTRFLLIGAFATPWYVTCFWK